MNNLTTLIEYFCLLNIPQSEKNKPKVEYNTDTRNIPNLLKSYLHANQ